MILPSTTLSVSTAPTSPPQFFFLGTQDHRVAFLLPALRNVPMPSALPALDPFVQAVFFAQDRVWILDPYFDHGHGLPTLFAQDAILESKATFCVISRQERPMPWLLTQNNWGAVSHRLSWKKREHGWFHGRFALVDNELWHFGSTVGGAYPRFDAASRWYDADIVSSFQYQFKNVWEADES